MSHFFYSHFVHSWCLCPLGFRSIVLWNIRDMPLDVDDGLQVREATRQLNRVNSSLMDDHPTATGIVIKHVKECPIYTVDVHRPTDNEAHLINANFYIRILRSHGWASWQLRKIESEQPDNWQTGIGALPNVQSLCARAHKYRQHCMSTCVSILIAALKIWKSAQFDHCNFMCPCTCHVNRCNVIASWMHPTQSQAEPRSWWLIAHP